MSQWLNAGTVPIDRADPVLTMPMARPSCLLNHMATALMLSMPIDPWASMRKNRNETKTVNNPLTWETPTHVRPKSVTTPARTRRGPWRSMSVPT